jgi:hypothetical protein
MANSKATFCDDCIATTSDVGTGNIGSINGTGARWYGAESPCPQCGSVIKTLRPSFFWIPLPVGAKFRVIELSKDRFIARALRDFAPGTEKVISSCPRCHRAFYNAVAEKCPDCLVPLSRTVP